MRIGRFDPLRFTLRPELVFQNGVARLFGRSLKFLVPDLAESATFFAGAVRRIEGKQSWIELFERAAAVRTTHLRAHHGEIIFRVEQVRRAPADIERALREFSRFRDSFFVNHADDNGNCMLFETREAPEL